MFTKQSKSSRERKLILLVLSLALALSACQPTAPPAEAGLALEEYRLEGPPNLDNGTFLPVGTSQEAVLDKHRTEREQTVSNEILSTYVTMVPYMSSLGPGQSLTGVLGISAADPIRQTVNLMQGEETLFSVEAGLPSPALPLQGLWSYEGHWVLEVLYAEGEAWEGRLYQDGLLLNESLEYQEAFGFQLLAGKPFYFFQDESGLGYSYDGEETGLPYDEIPHYGCCSASLLNPVQAENMVAFYAYTGDDWYYVELGDFNQD